MLKKKFNYLFLWLILIQLSTKHTIFAGSI